MASRVHDSLCRVLAFIAVLAASVGTIWFGAPGAAAGHSIDLATATYTLGGHHSSAERTQVVESRGPPSGPARTTTYDSVGHWEHGASLRPVGRTPALGVSHATSTARARPVNATTTTGRHAVLPDGGLSSHPRADVAANWVDEGGNLRSGRPSMPQGAYDYQSGTLGARSNPLTGRSMAPQLEMPGVDGSTVAARFDGINGLEAIDRKLNPVFSAKAVWQARRQAGVAAYNGFQAVWELPTPQSVSAANRFMDYAGISTIIVRQAN